MRLTFLIIVVGLLEVSASVYSQQTKLSMSLNNVTLEDAFRKIEDCSNFIFFYNADQVQLDQRVSLNAENKNIDEILSDLLKDKGISFKVTDRRIVLYPKNDTGLSASQQPITIKGKVSDSSGAPLPGVTVVIKGTTTGIITDVDGKYSLSGVPSNATLQFSFVGMRSQEIAVAGKTSINVTMTEETIGIDEVVAIGYQLRKRGQITGSIVDIGGESVELAASPSNTVRALQGKMSGLTITDRGGGVGDVDLDILIRGKSTLGSTSPLIVIDGVPSKTSDLIYMSANDIESISVLKDAAAAIYGARSANGVIHVTTKEGKKGKGKISFTSSFSLQRVTKCSEYMNSYEKAVYTNEAAEYEGETIPWTDEEIEHFRIQDRPLEYPDTDWYNEIVSGSAPMSNQNLTVQGGSDKIQYFFSGDLLHEGDVYKSDDVNFYNYQIRSNVKAQITKNLKMGINTSYRYEKRRTVPSVDDIWMSIAGSQEIVARYPNGLLGPSIGGENPITRTMRKYHFENRDNKEFNVIVNLSYDLSWITQGLNLSGNASYNNQLGFYKTFKNTGWEMYSYDSTNDEYIAVISDYNGGVRSVSETMTTEQTDFYNIKLNYARNFGENNISGFIAYEQSEYEYNYMYGYVKGLEIDSKPYLWAGQDEGREITGGKSESGRVNYFGSVFYNYANKYLVDFSLRYDGSFNFAEGHRFGLFGGMSLGYVISKEPFMKSLDWLDNLKLRASYGKMGNDAVDSYQYISTYSYGDAYDFGVDPHTEMGFYLSNVPNTIITWEESMQKNIGFDFSVLNGLFGVNMDYFYEKRRKILISEDEAVPVYTGLELPDKNLGKVDSHGFEFVLTHKNKIGNINYSIEGNLSYNQSKVIYRAEADDTPDYQKREGHPIDSYKVYKTDGIYHTQEEIDNSVHLSGTIPGDIKYVDVDKDGEITGDDMYRRHTSPIPEIQFGVNTAVSYKNFTVDVFFQGQTRAETSVTQEGIYASALKESYDGRWTPDNIYSKWPRAFSANSSVNARRSSDFWLIDATMLRLKSASISYKLPSNLISKIGLSNMELFLRGRNLFTWDKMPMNYDPEKVKSNHYYHPQMQTYTLGVKIDF